MIGGASDSIAGRRCREFRTEAWNVNDLTMSPIFVGMEWNGNGAGVLGQRKSANCRVGLGRVS